jgi:hypothetical protein
MAAQHKTARRALIAPRRSKYVRRDEQDQLKKWKWAVRWRKKEPEHGNKDVRGQPMASNQ